MLRRRDPAVAADHVERALIYQQAGKFQQALEACDLAIRLAPDRSDAHRLRGIALLGLKRYDEAVRALDTSLGKGAAPQAIHEIRGLAHSWSGAYDRAISDYTLGLSKGRPSSSLYGNRGWAYLMAGAPGPAIRDFNEALRLDAENAHALGGRALAGVQQRRAHEAVADTRSAVRLSPRDERQLYNAARVLCQAAVCLETDPVHVRGAWAAADRCRAECLDYLARATELHPEAGRARFWDEVVRADAALAPVRKSHKFLEMEARTARLPRSSLSEKENRHDASVAAHGFSAGH